MPMLARVDSGARVWQPPETLNAIGGGEQNMRNLISNPGFETVGTGWQNVQKYTDGTDDSGIKPHSGSRYAKTINGENIVSDPFEVTPGATLHASAWFYSPVNQRPAAVLIVFDDGIKQKKILKVGTGWTRILLDCTVPDDASTATIELYSSDWKRFDDVEVTEVI